MSIPVSMWSYEMWLYNIHICLYSTLILYDCICLHIYSIIYIYICIYNLYIIIYTHIYIYIYNLYSIILYIVSMLDVYTIYHGSHIGASNSQENGGPWVHEAGRDFLSCREGGKPFLTSNLWYVASPILTSNLVGLKYIQFGFEWFHPIWFWHFAPTPNFWETLEWISLPQCKTIQHIALYASQASPWVIEKKMVAKPCNHRQKVWILLFSASMFRICG